MNLKIEEGYCNQVVNQLMNVTSVKTAYALNKMAYSKTVKEIDFSEACRMGFEELAEWAIPEKYMLYLIDDYILLCLPKRGEETTEC